MVTRRDCFLLLNELTENGIDTKKALAELSSAKDVPINVVQFINQNRQLDLSNFYEGLRKNYNHKKSPLYGNIVKEIKDPNEVLTTLASFLTQALLYSKKAEDREMFLRHARVSDITKVLTKYFYDYDLTTCIKLIQVLKADIKALDTRSQLG